MSQARVSKRQIDGLLACYKILDYDVIDPETVVATFSVSAEQAILIFDEAEDQDLITQVHGSMYELTEQGQEQLTEIMLRR